MDILDHWYLGWYEDRTKHYILKKQNKMKWIKLLPIITRIIKLAENWQSLNNEEKDTLIDEIFDLLTDQIFKK